MQHSRVFRERLSIEDRKMIEKLLNQGLNGVQIGMHLNRSRNTINQEIRKNSKPYIAENAQKRHEAVEEERKEKIRRIFSQEEKEKITQMMDQGSSLNNIAKEMHCKVSKISYFLAMQGGHPKRSLSQRIEILEQQLDILFEMIRKENQ